MAARKPNRVWDENLNWTKFLTKPPISVSPRYRMGEWMGRRGPLLLSITNHHEFRCMRSRGFMQKQLAQVLRGLRIASRELRDNDHSARLRCFYNANADVIQYVLLFFFLCKGILRSREQIAAIR